MRQREDGWVPMPLYVDVRILAGAAEQPTQGQAAAVLRWIEQADVTAVSSPADVAGLSPGALVEVAGRTCGNPMVALLDLVATSLPLVFDPAAPPTPTARRAYDRRSSRPRRGDRRQGCDPGRRAAAHGRSHRRGP